MDVDSSRWHGETRWGIEKDGGKFLPSCLFGLVRRVENRQILRDGLKLRLPVIFAVLTMVVSVLIAGRDGIMFTGLLRLPKRVRDE